MLKVFINVLFYLNTVYANLKNEIDTDVVKTEHYVIWPKAVIPFYIDPEHFDNEQSLSIMTALSLVAFKTCLKFNPVLVRPTATQHVLVFENPNGVRRCVFNTEGHSPDGPHRVTLGYACMKSPQIDMILMRALGFPFEHNRASRDLFVDVQFENIDPSAIELFNKDPKLPPELRPLRYDVNSATHFGERDFSKNGHRTIIFKDHDVRQNRKGLSDLDLRKIEIVYGPECLKRERQEKIELCQNYPGVARRKREIDLSRIGPSLRVNRDITPPAELTQDKIQASTALAELGIENEARAIVEKIDQLSAAALRNARVKYCNVTSTDLRSGGDADIKDSDLLGTLQLLKDYAGAIVDHAGEDSNSFCEAPDSTDQYLRARCNRPDSRCRNIYRSTKSGDVRYSTQHRPIYPYPTRHPPTPKIFDSISFRSGNSSDVDDKVRTKREIVGQGSVKIKENDEVDKETRSHLPLKSDDVTFAANYSRLESTTGSAGEGRRRFKDSPFRVYKKNNYEKEGTDVSDLSLESKQNRGLKKVKPMTKIHWKHAKEIRGNRRNKREVPTEKSSTELKRNEEGVDREAKVVPGKSDVLIADQGSIKKNGESNQTVSGRRRFRDSPFSVYKPNENAKKSMYASDLSLEGERKTKISKSKQSTGERSTKKKIKIVDHSGDTEAVGVRRKRDAELERSSIERKENGGGDVEAKGAKSAEGIPLEMVLAEAVEGDTNRTVAGRRRFKDTPFRIHKRNKSGKGEDVSDLSLEDRQERTFKNAAREPVKIAPKKRETRGSDRFEEIRKARERVGRPHKGVPRTVQLSKGNEEFYADRRWPEGAVRYSIKDIPKYDLDDVRYRLEEVNKILKEKTCVRLLEITEAEKSLFEDYLELDNSPDYVTGRVGGKQSFGVVELFEGGQHRQHAAMVVMSMLGFYFEPSRHDRDRYIRVHPRHIRPDKLHHFEKLRPEATLPLPYDYRSATHPAWQFWRHIGKTGISSLATYKDQDPDGSIMKSLGHNVELLSELDIVKINSVYGVECFH